MGLFAQCGDLVRRVQRAELGRLRDRHHAGLHVVLDALDAGEIGQLLGDELAVDRRQVDQLGAERSFGRPGLVDGDVRPVGAHDAVVRPGQ